MYASTPRIPLEVREPQILPQLQIFNPTFSPFVTGSPACHVSRYASPDPSALKFVQNTAFPSTALKVTPSPSSPVFTLPPSHSTNLHHGSCPSSFPDALLPFSSLFSSASSSSKTRPPPSLTGPREGKSGNSVPPPSNSLTPTHAMKLLTLPHPPALLPQS
ncbi:hypothetical protein VUR80DRAFT_5514 [Thermomyces stellatus]